LSVVSIEIEFELLDYERLYEARTRARNRVRCFPPGVFAAAAFDRMCAKKIPRKSFFLHPFNTPTPLLTLKNITQDERPCGEALPCQQLASAWIKYRQLKDLFA
jgi:hypothetical protein